MVAGEEQEEGLSHMASWVLVQLVDIVVRAPRASVARASLVAELRIARAVVPTKHPTQRHYAQCPLTWLLFCYVA